LCIGEWICEARTRPKIIEIDVIGDPDRAARVAAAVLGQRP